MCEQTFAWALVSSRVLLVSFLCPPCVLEVDLDDVNFDEFDLDLDEVDFDMADLDEVDLIEADLVKGIVPKTCVTDRRNGRQ